MDAAKAVEVETAVGAVITTAPETLPRREPDPFQPGDSVRHARFGVGRVMYRDGENFVLRFKGGMKRVRPTYLKPA